MKSSQLHAQSPRRALLWSGRTGPFTSSCPEVLNYQKTTQENSRAVFASYSEVVLHKISALLYHSELAVQLLC